MTHSEVDEADREEAGITDNLVRISVGVENPEDIIKDVDTAFEYVQQKKVKMEEMTAE
jgi:cystathionine beta-lyase/cystathionine gamma-synthase